MAADVLAYRTNEVPVGDDQRQHVELMRDVALRFNSYFGEHLVVPEARIPSVGARIMDLQNPESKMSTTGGSEEGTLYVLDEPALIERKLKRAVTDSGEGIHRAPDKPGITNLIDILAVVRGVGPEAIEREFAALRYGDLKAALTAEVTAYRASRRRSRKAPRVRVRSLRRRSPMCATRWASGRHAERARRRGAAVAFAACISRSSSWTSTSSAVRSTCC
jgi:tryptophanyl-tRNA synthetase